MFILVERVESRKVERVIRGLRDQEGGREVGRARRKRRDGLRKRRNAEGDLERLGARRDHESRSAQEERKR